MDYHPTKLKDKEVFVALAKAYINDVTYLDELYDTTCNTAQKYNIETDFLGFTYFSGKMGETILDLLGDDFSYWYYECDQSFEKFNDNIEYSDGTHPEVYSLSDLFDFSTEESE